MLEGDRYEVLDIDARPRASTSARRSATCPSAARSSARSSATATAIFPHGDDVLEAGDRVIIFTEAANATLGRRGPVS